MKHFGILFCCFFFSVGNLHFLNAQPATFVKTFKIAGSSAEGMRTIEVNDGFVTLVFTIDDTLGNVHTMLLKTDSQGNLLWTKEYTIKGNTYFWPYDIAITPDSGFVFNGSMYDDTLYNWHGFLIRVNAAGDTLWTKTLTDNYAITGPIITKDGGIALEGYLVNEAFLFKLDSGGNMLWQKYIGDSTKILSSIIQAADGGYAIAGHIYKTMLPDSTKGYMIKTDSLGNFEWDFTSNEKMSFRDIIQDIDGNFIIAGSIYLNDSIYLAKISKAGSLIWQKSLKGDFDLNYFPTDIIQTGTGYVLTGGSEINSNHRSLFIIQTDFSGNILWKKEIYGFTINDEIYSGSIQKTKDNTFILGGTLLCANEPDKVLLLKTDTLGDIPAKPIVKIIQDSLYITTPADYYQWNFNGSPITNATNPYFIATNTGWYSVTLTDTFSCIAYEATTVTSDSVYFSITGIQDKMNNRSFFVYPNPANDKVHIGFNSVNTRINEVKIFNTLGEIIFNSNGSSSSEFEIDLLAQPTGIYFIQVKADNIIYNKKLIKR